VKRQSIKRSQGSDDQWQVQRDHRGQGVTNIDCVGTRFWSVELSPAAGQFEKGAAIGTAETAAGRGVLAASVSSTRKAFSVK
jgi:hypothetical protein